jgi:RHS repeat-associated protein
MLSITNADSRTKRYEYDGVNLTRESDWKGQFTSYRYDRINRLTEMIDRVGQLTTISYNDANGLTKTITDRRTNQRVESYDALGRMSSVRVGGQLLASYEYDASSNRTAVIDGRNNRTQYSYDAFNRVTSVNHAGIQTETFGYDESGNLTSYFDGRGGSVGQVFDELNRVISRTDGAGNTTQFKYDGRGLLTELIEPKRDAQNNPVSRTLYEYNELGSLTKVIDANQGVWQYGYDAEQKLTSITDAEGRTPTTFEYDVLHRMTKTTRPLGMVTSASFDANGNRKTQVDALGRKTTTTYDALDRARSIAITNSDNTIPQGRSGYTLDYDPEGNLLAIAEQIRNGATTNTRNYSRTYDSRNRLTRTTDAFGRSVSYGYDATNNVTTMSDAANRQTAYSYDAMNRLDVASLPGGRQVNHDWTADGLLSKVEYGNGMSRVYGYDNGDRVTSIINTHSASESEEFVYGYDANSNRESETRKRNGSTTRSIAYQFDALNRLIQASYGGGASVSYGYDKVGNRLSELGTEVGGTLVNRTYAYDELNRMSSVSDALTPAQSSTLSYDLNGNLLKEAKPNGQEQRYEYDALNQMSRAASFANNTETTLGSYDYDFEGRRIAKTVGSATTQYVYSGINVVNEFDGNNQLTASYDFGADLLRSEFAGEGERLYFHDALGSTTSLATNTGATVARYEYDAWGKLISAVQPSANKVNYTGYRKDEETGLDYAQARYYDSSKGRFTSFDPITENGERMNQPQGMNYYGYVMGNPLKYTDPQGTDWFEQNNTDHTRSIRWFPGKTKEGWSHIDTPYTFENTAGQWIKLTNQKSSSSYKIVVDVPQSPKVKAPRMPVPKTGTAHLTTQKEAIDWQSRLRDFLIEAMYDVVGFTGGVLRGYIAAKSFSEVWVPIVDWAVGDSDNFVHNLMMPNKHDTMSSLVGQAVGTALAVAQDLWMFTTLFLAALGAEGFSTLGGPGAMALVAGIDVAVLAGPAAMVLHDLWHLKTVVSSIIHMSASSGSSGGGSSSGGSNSGGSSGNTKGPLEGEIEYEVYDPAKRGRTITDIDKIEGNVLWEEKGAVNATNRITGADETTAWLSKNITAKFNKIIEARTHLPSFYKDSEIGFHFTTPGADANFRAAVETEIQNLRIANPGVKILTKWE